MALLIAVAESAQDAAACFNSFLDPVPEISTEITGLMARCLGISSALRTLHTTKEDHRTYHEYDLIYADVLDVRMSLEYTFSDIKRLIGDLGHTGHISRRAAYYQVWREIDSHFYQESRVSLSKRLECNFLFLAQLNHILIDGRPLDEDEYYDLRDFTAEILRTQAPRLDAAFNSLSIGDPGHSCQQAEVVREEKANRNLHTTTGTTLMVATEAKTRGTSIATWV
ncbi:MAG: hypothetical protein LQ352_003259 [Teloschistes flavicans]|nr:MAG: hypothetical protein LQ352_003259 [Teloschistes flavicans]